MRHPFDLDPSELAALDLDFAEQLTDEEAAQVGGGSFVTTLALGEEGGCWPKPQPKPTPIDPPITSKALGEEGGITEALCEDGGEPITDALCEDGGYITQSCAETGCDLETIDLIW
jgi:hypothetical protein